MTLVTCNIALAGLELRGAYDGKQYYIAVIEAMEVLGKSRYFTRDLQGGKSPELAQAAGFDVGAKLTVNKRVGRTTQAFFPTKLFAQLIGALAVRGEKPAQVLLMATLNEALERRIDSALGQTKDENSYEQETKAFFRELSRRIFIPELSSWHHADGGFNYGRFVNEFKTALRLPLVNVDGYSRDEMMRWSRGITAYNCLRAEGAGHKYAVAAVRRQQADC